MNKKKVIAYLLITFAITYTSWWGLALLTNLKLINSSQPLFTFIHFIGGFGPTIAAILVLPEKHPKSVLKFIFFCKKGAFWYLLLFCAIQAAVVGISSMELNSQLPWHLVPAVMLTATIAGGGNEELGWRGMMQPELEKQFPYLIATLITGCVWMAWHIPLWFIQGTSQQGSNFVQYCIYGLVLSFWLAALYKRTKSVFFCAVFHGFSNLMLSLFVIKINWILAAGLLVSVVFSVWFYYADREEK